MITPFTSPGVPGVGRSGVSRAPNALSDSRKNWIATAQQANALVGLHKSVADMQAQLDLAKKNGLIIDNFHPFKIYSVPAVLRATPNPVTDWRTFRVRCGRVGTQDLTGDGCDGFTENPDYEFIPTLIGQNTITLTGGAAIVEITVAASTAAHYFWIDTSTGTPVLHSGTSPTSGGWASYPTLDGQHYLIGWVNTQDTTNARAIIRQIIRTDIVPMPASGSGGVQMIIKQIYSDYLRCHTWDTSTTTPTEGTTDILVAKDYLFRMSYTHQVVDGVTFSFTYGDANNRTSASGGVSQTECCIPRFVVYSTPAGSSYVPMGVIVAKPVDHTGLDDITWMDDTARVWARRFNQ